MTGIHECEEAGTGEFQIRGAEKRDPNDRLCRGIIASEKDERKDHVG